MRKERGATNLHCVVGLDKQVANLIPSGKLKELKVEKGEGDYLQWA